MCVDLTCPHRLVIEKMPFPFASFDNGREGYILTQYNHVFKEEFEGAVGDALCSFSFFDKGDVIEHNKKWYQVISYSVGITIVYVFINITDRVTEHNTAVNIIGLVAEMI